MNYELAYRIGFHPWEDAEEQAGFVESFERLVGIEEARSGPPFGKALDVGTGCGIWGIELAKRGWDVTGIDVVSRVLGRARDRVRDAGVEMRLCEGDVTDLRAAGIGSGYRLILDTGTFHGLRPEECRAMGREVDALAADDATVLLLAWEPKRRGPLPRGVTIEEISECFPGWEPADAGPTGFEAPKPVELLLRPDERWYRLRRA